MNVRANISVKENLSKAEKEAIIVLWNQEYPKRLNLENLNAFDEYLNALSQKEHYLLFIDGEIKGWAFTFLREEETWFAIIIDQKVQGMGNGLFLINKIKEIHTELNGWVIYQENELKQDGQFYDSPLNFYLKNDFNICENIRLENDKMSALKIKWVRKK